VNRYQGVDYFSKERFEELLLWLPRMALLEAATAAPGRFAIEATDALLRRTAEWAAQCGYRVDRFLAGEPEAATLPALPESPEARRPARDGKAQGEEDREGDGRGDGEPGESPNPPGRTKPPSRPGQRGGEVR
jgi:hypothetical protein